MSAEAWPPPMPDFDAEPWKGRIEYSDYGFGLPKYSIDITHGVFRYGPDGGSFSAWTYKGAKRKMERILRQCRARQAKKLGFREVQESARATWEREFATLRIREAERESKGRRRRR